MQVPFMANRMRRSIGYCGLMCLTCCAAAGLALSGCRNTPTSLPHSPAPLREPPPELAESTSFEDSLTGGQVFSMYCAQCHNARPLAERPFSNYQNVAAHMRVRANLTGKEYAKLMEFLRRWHDVPPPTPPDEPPPKRFIFGQPVPELQDNAPQPKTVPPVPTSIPQAALPEENAAG